MAEAFDSAPFDFIAAGGGSSGVAVAARVNEDRQVRVLLIEAGHDYSPGQEPAAVQNTFHTVAYGAENMLLGLLVHWRSSNGSLSQPLPPPQCEQARIVGGGSSVNAMAAIRALADDYNEWMAFGARGWSRAWPTLPAQG